jgi:CubicO group peptidase (beta-lactamase class C family)
MRALPVYLALAGAVHASFCDSPSPSFLLPQLDSTKHQSALHDAAIRIDTALAQLISKPIYNATHYSLEVTSPQSTIYNSFHTATHRSNLFHGGAKTITNTSAYRIASMTKPFTVLALFQLAEAGQLGLDHSILEYLPDLNTTGAGKGAGGLPWKDITLRSLAGQSSGVPSNLAQVDLMGDGERLGLPPLDSLHEDLRLPKCDELINYTRKCTTRDLLDWVDQLPPVFAPNQFSSYSNIGFDLLGLVVANVSGVSYEEYIQKNILRELGMKGTSFETPGDDVAAIPLGIEYYWNFTIGVQNPTGGLYSSSADMSTWVRYVLGTFNAHAKLNWFAPVAWGTSLNTFFGLPWETYRVKIGEVVEGRGTRPLTFVMKGGGLPGYTSNIVMVPELGFGITILVAGDGRVLKDVQEVVMREMVAFADDVGKHDLQGYVGTYEGAKGKLVLDADVDGLIIKSWNSDGVDVLKGLVPDQDNVVFRVVPSLLYANEEKQKGERWGFEILQVRKDGQKASVWDNFCIANMEGPAYYAGKPINELVFSGEQDQERHEVHLTGFRTTLTKKRRSKDDGTEVVLEL